MNTSGGIIIRLQRLPMEANSADVREFFHGLRIPDGGVHIIGGREGDAFIAFSNDEDARQAMRMDGKRLKSAKVKLLLSSRSELQQIIEKAHQEMKMHQATAAVNTSQDRPRDARRRSPSRSPERLRNQHHHQHHNRRSRSRSPIERGARGGGHFEGIRHHHPQRNDPAPPHAPSNPISGFSSFRNEPTESRFQTGPSSAMDPRFLDRPPLNQPMFPSKLRDGPPIGDKEFGSNFNKPSFVGGNGRFPSGGGGEPFGGGSIIRPGGNHHNQFGSTAAFNDQPPPGPMSGYGYRPRFEAQSPLEANVPFEMQQQGPQQSATSMRVPRRGLLPPPPEEMGGNSSGFPSDANIQQRPTPLFQARPLMDHPIPSGEFQHQPLLINPASNVRPSLLAPPRDGGRCVRMTGVPQSLLRYGSIRDFFAPLRLDGADKIKIVVDTQEHRTGQVYCKFSSVEDADQAALRTGRENIYVRTCTDDEFEKAVDGGGTTSRQRSRSKDRDSDTSSLRSRREGSRSRSSVNETKEIGNNIEDDFILEVGNIPYKATHRDLRMMFEDFRPVEIRRLYKYHHINRKVVTSDTAFVIFETMNDAMCALRKANCRLIDRDVRLKESSRAIMDDAFNRAPPTPPESVAEWAVREPGTSYQQRRQTRPSHDYGPPASRSPPPRRPSPSTTYPRALMAKTISPVLQSNSNSNNAPSSPILTSTPKSAFTQTCVCVKGVAANATNRDVAAFFYGLAIVPNGIRISKDTMGGMAYVEFCSSVDCEQAIKKDRSYIGVQMVTVRPCFKEEMMEAVQKHLGTNGRGNTPPMRINSPNVPPAASSSTSVPNPIVVKSEPNVFVKLEHRPNGTGGSSSAGQQFFAAELDEETKLLYLQQMAALAKQREEEESLGGGGRLQMDLNEFDVAPSTSSFNQQQPPLQIVDDYADEPPPIDLNVVCEVGVPGCVAALHNLPPQITLEQICDLFQEYQLIDDSVRMHYSNGGVATGDCLLAFTTSQNAHTAVANVNGTVIGGQVIKMYVVPT